MEKEESSGEKLEGLPKQEVSKIHGDQCTSAVAKLALPPCTAGLALSALLQGTGEPALPVALLCAGFAMHGSAPHFLRHLCSLERSFCCCLCVSCRPQQHLPCGELRGIEGWGQPWVLAFTLGFRSHVGPWQRSWGYPKRNGPGGEEKQ